MYVYDWAENFRDVGGSLIDYEPMVKINASFEFPLFCYQLIQIGF